MAAHPYSPAGLDLPGYVPQRLSQLQILGPYLGTSLLVFAAVWVLSGRCGSRLSRADRLLMCWWAFTGLTHLVVEGPFLFTPGFTTKENPNYFDESMKEYSKGDSRYVARDTVVVTVELITVLLEGPASLLAVHIFHFTVSLGQLYGCILYFATAYLDGFNFWASPFYFWAYFIGANCSWIVIPLLIARAGRGSVQQFNKLRR